MIELLILVVGITALITFWGTFKKLGNVVDGSLDLGINTVNVINKTGNKSLKVYARDVDIAIARKKQEQMVDITEIGTIPTDDELDALLKLAGE